MEEQEGGGRVTRRTAPQGIVTESTPLLERPSLTSVIKDTGLLLFSYGDRNTSYDAVALQKAWGVDAVISDNIGDLTKLAGKVTDSDYSLWREHGGAARERGGEGEASDSE